MTLTINKQHKALFYDDRANRKALDMLIIHSTNSNQAEGTIQWFMNPKNPAKSSSHYVVSQTGEIFQMVEEEDIAYHAGKSEWIIDGKVRTNISYYSIGIEVACDQISSYTTVQLQALVELCNDIITRRKINTALVLRHSDISPGRKRDPYPPNLDWVKFKEKLMPIVELPDIPHLPVWKNEILDFYKSLVDTENQILRDPDGFVREVDPYKILSLAVKVSPSLTLKFKQFLLTRYPKPPL